VPTFSNAVDVLPEAAAAHNLECGQEAVHRRQHIVPGLRGPRAARLGGMLRQADRRFLAGVACRQVRRPSYTARDS
jgi:hypothetical protein